MKKKHRKKTKSVESKRWERIWRDFGAWCDSQKDYPYGWADEQRPALQKTMMHVFDTKLRFSRTWREFDHVCEVRDDGFASNWDRQKTFIRKAAEDEYRDYLAKRK